MTCKGCNHEFCWVCKQNYHQHNPTACLSHVLTYYGVLLNFLFNFFIYYGFHISIFNGIVYTFLIILKYKACIFH
jgi:ariadne-1